MELENNVQQWEKEIEERCERTPLLHESAGCPVEQQ